MATAAQTPAQDVRTKAESKKTKKVWTNENLAEAGGTISVVGEARSTPKAQAKIAGKPSADKPVDPRLVAGFRQQLEKLQAQLAEVDRQLADLKGFSKGTGKNSGGIQRNTWEYNTSSVDEQLRGLQGARNQIQGAIDNIYDDARRRGIEPGQLR